MRTSEAPVGVYLWIVILVVNAVMIIGMDLWLHRNGYEMLTTEFKEGLNNAWTGPLLCFLTAGSFAAFVWHMWTSRGQ